MLTAEAGGMVMVEDPAGVAAPAGDTTTAITGETLAVALSVA